MEIAKYLFGDIVVVEDNLLGVVLKTWETISSTGHHYFNYDIYVRAHSYIKNYQESQVERYRVRHKYLDEEELRYQRGED